MEEALGSIPSPEKKLFYKNKIHTLKYVEENMVMLKKKWKIF
jgi:hypothetical protein